MMSLLAIAFSSALFRERWDLRADLCLVGVASVVAFDSPVELLGCSLPGVASMASAAFVLGLIMVGPPELDIVLTLLL
jgi:hypothetical protein